MCAKIIVERPKTTMEPEPTTHKMTDLLSDVVVHIRENYKDRPDLVLAAWPEVMGPQLASMTQAISFADGILHVKVEKFHFT